MYSTLPNTCSPPSETFSKKKAKNKRIAEFTLGNMGSLIKSSSKKQQLKSFDEEVSEFHIKIASKEIKAT